MTEEYEWKEYADQAIQEIEEFVNIESQFIRTGHKFLSALLGIDYIFAHLEETIPEGSDLHRLLGKICAILVEIKDVIESDESKELKFEQEEKRLLAIFEYASQHKNWRLVRKIISAEEKLESSVERLQEEELKGLHSKFRRIKRLTNRINLGNIDEKVRHYLIRLIKLLSAYERILWHLLKKEKILKKKLRK